MKRLFLSIAFMCAMLTNAQTLKYDLNADGVEDVSDVSFLVNYLLNKGNEDPYNGHEYVDLGLSVKWATMNVGATEVAGSKKNSHTGKLDCYGEYYAWGETEPKDSYTLSNLKYHSGNTTSSFSKYVTKSSYGSVDNKATLELTDDAACINWGGTWRIPTYAEITELLDNCYWEWTTSYNNSNVKGYIVYKVKDDSDKGKKNSYNSSITPTSSYNLDDNHIFIPAAGYRHDNSVDGCNDYGGYWSSSLYSSMPCEAFFLNLESGRVNLDATLRDKGLSIRAVCP